jgi:uncharacterized protein YgiM (DUF1202 family)
MLTLVPALGIGSAGSVSAATSGGAIVQTALRYVGYPYTTVGNSPATGFSCIGFVSYVYQSNGIPLPDDLGGAMGFSPQIPFADLQPGDVLYFANTVWAGLSHTAIYLGGGRFVHAEWYNRGVVISSFTNDPVDFNYWQSHYLGANRPWTYVGSAPPAPPAAPTRSSPTSSSVAPATSPRATQPSLAPLQEGPRARVQVLGLNVRLRPSLGAPIRRLVRDGTTVVVLKSYDSWDWVQFPDRSYGWVAHIGIGGSAGSGSSSSSSAAAQPYERPIGRAAAAVGGLRVHLRPGLSAAVLTTAYLGQNLVVLKRWSEWTRVQLGGGTRGWVYSAYLNAGSGQRRESVSSTAAPRRASPSVSAYGSVHVGTRVAALPTGSRLTAGVRVHYHPGLRAPVMGLAGAGTRVHVLARQGSWTRVRFAGGNTGWVYSLYVR